MKKYFKPIVFTITFISNAFFPLWSFSQTSSGNNVDKIPIPGKNPKVESAPPLSVQEDPQNSLGLIYSAKKLEEAKDLINSGRITDAEKILVPIKDWLIETTNNHYVLHQVFNKSSKSQNESKIEKAHAFDFGTLRDQAFFLLAKVYIHQSKLKEATRLLIEVIKSEPETSLGKDTYKTLQEIKFSD